MRLSQPDATAHKPTKEPSHEHPQDVKHPRKLGVLTVMNYGHRRNIKREARCGFEGAQTSFAKHDVVVAIHGEIFRSGQPFRNATR